MPARAALPASCLSRQASRQARRQAPRDRRAASTGPPMCRCRRPPWVRLRPPAARRILSAPGPKLINAQAAGAWDTANLPPHRLIGRPPVPGRVGFPPGIGRGGRCAFPAQARPTGPCRAPRRVAVCHDMLVQDVRVRRSVCAPAQLSGRCCAYLARVCRCMHVCSESCGLPGNGGTSSWGGREQEPRRSHETRCKTDICGRIPTTLFVDLHVAKSTSRSATIARSRRSSTRR